eukprot:gene7314-biopygen1500
MTPRRRRRREDWELDPPNPGISETHYTSTSNLVRPLRPSRASPVPPCAEKKGSIDAARARLETLGPSSAGWAPKYEAGDPLREAPATHAARLSMKRRASRSSSPP